MIILKVNPDAYSYAEEKIKEFSDSWCYVAIGGVDVGKSSFTISLSAFLLKKGYDAFFLDLDLGQSTIGLPLTISLGRLRLVSEDSVGVEIIASEFVGNNTPEGLEPLIVSRSLKLFNLVPRDKGKLVVDTCGYVNSPRALGYKKGIIENIDNSFVIVISEEPWAKKFISYLPNRKALISPLPNAKKRDFQTRKERRELLFRQYFSTDLTLFSAGTHLFYFPYPLLSLKDCLTGMVKYKCVIKEEELIGLIVGLRDGRGEFMGLGRIIEKTGINLLVETPIKNVRYIRFIELSRLRLDNQYKEIGKLLIFQKEV
ncbi:MAG: Clp1/GlmU family protein [bacterium]|nr:Clp1/GlmU family protein [bacterium]